MNETTLAIIAISMMTGVLIGMALAALEARVKANRLKREIFQLRNDLQKAQQEAQRRR